MALETGREFLGPPKLPGTHTWIPGTFCPLPGTEQLLALYKHRRLLTKNVLNKLSTLGAGVALPGTNYGTCLPHGALKISESFYNTS